jgi:hypothetical protein
MESPRGSSLGTAAEQLVRAEGDGEQMKRRLGLGPVVGLAFLVAASAPAASARTGVTPNLSQQAKLVASDATQRDYFGHSVAISADGTIAVAGAWGRGLGVGTAYAFVQSGGVWTQQQRLNASDPANGDQFGTSVAVSSDGTTAIVGAESKNSSTGAAYVFTRSGGIWTQQQKLTAGDAAAGSRFGSSLGLSADGATAIIGSRGNGLGPGAAYVFTRSGGVWTQQQKLTAGDGAAGDYFGSSVALSADGATALAGAPAKTSSTGAAYVFTSSGGVWTQQQKLTAGDPASGDSFGTSVATSTDGSAALVGASGKSGYTGAAYAFTRSGGVWTQQQKLTASNGLPADAFGVSVALSSTGSIGIISAPGKLNNSGSIYEFTRAGGVWSQAGEATSSDNTSGDTVGSAVSLTGTGGTALVGADGVLKFTGAAYVFTVDAGPVIDSFTPLAGKVGSSVTLTGQRFTGATDVSFNGASASFIVNNDTQITATVPSEGTTGKISVTTPGGSALSAKAFKVKPAISSFTPTSGPVGTPVTLSGSGLLGTTNVSFNGVSASFTVVDSHTIDTTVPAGATSGKISVTTAGGTVRSLTSFHVT